MISNNQSARIAIPESVVSVNYPDMYGGGGQVTRPLRSAIVVSTLPMSFSVRDPNKRAYTPMDKQLEGEPGLIPWYGRAVANYYLPEAPNQGQGNDGWSCLQVFDYVQLIENAQGLMGVTDPDRPLAWEAVWKSGTELANNFLQGSKPWGRFPLDGHYRDGVGMAVVASLDEITPALIQRLQAERTEALQDVVRAADAIYANEGRRREILEGHRTAARILGIARPYADENVQTKRCIACQSAIAVNALTCKHCQQNLLTYWRDLVEGGFYELKEVEGHDYIVWERLSRVMPEGKVRTKAKAKPADPVTSPVIATETPSGGGLDAV